MLQASAFCMIHSEEDVSNCYLKLKFFLWLINSNPLSHNPKKQTVIQLICNLNNNYCVVLVAHWASSGYRWGWVSEGPISHIQTGDLVVLVDLCLGRWGILYHAVSKLLPRYKILVDNKTFQLQDKGCGGKLPVCQLTDEAPCMKPLSLKCSKKKKRLVTVHTKQIPLPLLWKVLWSLLACLGLTHCDFNKLQGRNSLSNSFSLHSCP